MAGNLQADQLFLGLTRPATVLGVHYIIFLCNFMLNVLVFINTVNNKFVVATVSFVTIHVLAYLICLKEPRAIELVMVRYGKCNRCKNRVYHKHTNSYDMS